MLLASGLGASASVVSLYVWGFLADNSSHYANHQVAEQLEGPGGVCQAAPVALQRRRVGGVLERPRIRNQCGNGRFPGKGV